jgi:predicted lipid-binding transport protein (Tim44 family)
MNKTFLALGALIVGAVFFAAEAEAKRLGGGRTVGTQRNVTQQQAAPAQKAPQAAPQAPAPQAAPAPAGSRWAGILGGLAIGGLLGYLFAGNGLLGALAVAGVVLLAFMGIAMLMRGRMAPRAAVAGPGNMSMPVPEQAPMSAGSALPAGFDLLA